MLYYKATAGTPSGRPWVRSDRAWVRSDALTESGLTLRLRLPPLLPPSSPPRRSPSPLAAVPAPRGLSVCLSVCRYRRRRPVHTAAALRLRPPPLRCPPCCGLSMPLPRRTTPPAFVDIRSCSLPLPPAFLPIASSCLPSYQPEFLCVWWLVLYWVTGRLGLRAGGGSASPTFPHQAARALSERARRSTVG